MVSFSKGFSSSFLSLSFFFFLFLYGARKKVNDRGGSGLIFAGSGRAQASYFGLRLHTSG
jgi:hypothetical protein